MVEKEQRGFVFHTSEGEQELTIEEVKTLAGQGDPDGLYALGMAYLFGWDIGQAFVLHPENLPPRSPVEV